MAKGKRTKAPRRPVHFGRLTKRQKTLWSTRIWKIGRDTALFHTPKPKEPLAMRRTPKRPTLRERQKRAQAAVAREALSEQALMDTTYGRVPGLVGMFQEALEKHLSDPKTRKSVAYAGVRYAYDAGLIHARRAIFGTIERVILPVVSPANRRLIGKFASATTAFYTPDNVKGEQIRDLNIGLVFDALRMALEATIADATQHGEETKRDAAADVAPTLSTLASNLMAAVVTLTQEGYLPANARNRIENEASPPVDPAYIGTMLRFLRAICQLAREQQADDDKKAQGPVPWLPPEGEIVINLAGLTSVERADLAAWMSDAKIPTVLLEHRLDLDARPNPPAELDPLARHVARRERAMRLALEYSDRGIIGKDPTAIQNRAETLDRWLASEDRTKP